MMTVHVLTDGDSQGTESTVERISEHVAQDRDLLWVDVVAPSPDDLRLLGEEFRFHHLALEDASKRHQRPKIELYDGFLFLVFYGLEIRDGEPVPVEIDLFVGKNYVVSVHAEPFAAIDETARRWYEGIGHREQRNVALLVYALLDAIVDGYFPVVDDVADRIDAIEEQIFERADVRTQQTIFALKKDLLAIRRVLGPERDVLNVLLRRDVPIFDAETVVYLQDVYDHILRVTDAIDTYREVLASALDAYLSVASNRLNQVMKTLTASSIILMSMTLIAGVYGMNFDRMPELGWRFGYPWALGLMALVGALMYGVFRRARWL